MLRPTRFCETLLALVTLCLTASTIASEPAAVEPDPPQPFFDLVQWTPEEETETVRYFRTQSPLLSAFWGRAMHLEAVVVLPPDHSVDERLPVSYFIHGYGNWQTNFDFFRPKLEAALADPKGNYPRMIYVFPNAQIPMGHTVFADSVNMGPWGAAFVEELAPALEAEYGGSGRACDRFVTGFSSGGWAALWLQVQHPSFFGGVWAVSPDPVDFRYFTGVNIYTFRNLYETPAGDPVQFMRRDCEFEKTLREFVEYETSRYTYGFQFWSFDAVFSPRGPDGRPMPLFDRATGEINRQVVRSWRDYDLRRILKQRWSDLASELSGKLHVYVGECDNFRLEEGVHALEETLQDQGADAEFVYVPEGGHWLYENHEDFFHGGLMAHLHRQMAATAADCPRLEQ